MSLVLAIPMGSAGSQAVKVGAEPGAPSRARRARERDTFGPLVSPGECDKLLAGKLEPSGEQIRVAVRFSDSRAFSAVSEKIRAPDIVALPNQYLTAMTEALIAPDLTTLPAALPSLAA